jgi:DNA-binding IclR family transcriptional regulator
MSPVLENGLAMIECSDSTEPALTLSMVARKPDAAISVSMPPSRMTPERMVTEVLPILRRGADTLRAML